MVKPSARVSLDSLVDLACRDGVDVRPTLLRVLTDLYVQRPIHSAEEETQYVELALGLIDTVDSQTRATVAAKLRQYSKAPAAVLRKLAASGTADPPDADATGELIDLFFSASTEERRLILVNLDITSEAAKRRPMPGASELVRRLESAALRRNPAEFSRILERALSTSRTLAERITYDHSGEPIVVAAKALGISIEILQRILLFLNPAIGQSAQRLYELCILFDDLTPAAAERMLSIWQAGAARPRTAHESIYWDDERRGARAQSQQASPRPPAKREIQTSRGKINQR
jgi:uncharacterized protein (DUF2336 family)